VKGLLLSVCIPTYNRSMILKRTIQNIIKLNSDDFEIVISDNGSEDDTKEVVTSIIDSRIKYYSNGNNKGGTFNIVKVLELAIGEYCLLLSDEDDAELDNVLKLLKSFKDIDPVVIKGNHFDYYSNSIGKNFKTFSFRFYYMSGLIFKRNSINFSDLKIELSKERYGYLNSYPHIYLTNQLLLKGSIFTTRIKFFRFRDNGNDYSEKIDNLHYSDLMSRFHQTKSSIDYVINNLDLANNIKIPLLLSLYRGFLYSTRGDCEYNQNTLDSSAISRNDMEIEIKHRIIGAFSMRPVLLLKLKLSEYYVFIRLTILRFK